MSELRFDPIGRRWVIVAGARGHRPSDFAPVAHPPSDEPCPLCAIVTGAAPATRIAVHPRGDDRVEVVANRFPALRVERDLSRAAKGPYDRVAGVGAHEVVIETTHHDAAFSELPAAQIASVCRVWRDRIIDLRRDRRFQHIIAFKNAGVAAGASLRHAHSQIVATPIRSARVDRELEATRAHLERTERCLLCDVIAFERDDGARVVEDGERFVAFAPYAAALPFQLTIAPTAHQHDFAALSEADADALGGLISRCLTRLRRALRAPDYNITLQAAPNLDAISAPSRASHDVPHAWHWRLEIIPRLRERFGGFELGTETCVNPTSPEDAATHLRGLD